MPIPAMAELALSFPLNWGPFGVALFFVISGFVIPFSFETYGRLDFIVARFFRIYPTYLTGLSFERCRALLLCWVADWRSSEQTRQSCQSNDR